MHSAQSQLGEFLFPLLPSPSLLSSRLGCLPCIPSILITTAVVRFVSCFGRPCPGGGGGGGGDLSLSPAHRCTIQQAVVLVAVVHLVACRDWPPYVVKNIPLGELAMYYVARYMLWLHVIVTCVRRLNHPCTMGGYNG